MAAIMRKAVLPLFFVVVACATVSANNSRTVNGEAIVRSIGENRVAVLVDTNDDKAIDQGFLLSSDLPISATSTHCPAAHVEYTESYVRVTYAKKVIDLYVAGYPEPPATPEQHETTKFIGYALTHSTGNSGCTLERAMADGAACYKYGKD